MKSTDKRCFGDIVLVDLVFSDGEWIIKDTSWDQWEMTEEWPCWEWRMQYEYKEQKYDIASWSL